MSEPEESDQERLARNLNELLQELRVAQAGVQILFAFLLAVAFADGFDDTNTFQRGTHLVTTLLATASAGFLIAPAAWHRLLFRHGRREKIVSVANRFAIIGLALMAAAMAGAVLLVATVTLPKTPAILLATAAATLFGILWFLLPLRHRTTGHKPPTPPRDARPPTPADPSGGLA